jgi:hypothetical protein
MSAAPMSLPAGIPILTKLNSCPSATAAEPYRFPQWLRIEIESTREARDQSSAASPS